MFYQFAFIQVRFMHVHSVIHKCVMLMSRLYSAYVQFLQFPCVLMFVILHMTRPSFTLKLVIYSRTCNWCLVRADNCKSSMHCQTVGHNELLTHKTITWATSTMTACERTLCVHTRYITNATARSTVVRFVTAFYRQGCMLSTTAEH